MNRNVRVRQDAEHRTIQQLLSSACTIHRRVLSTIGVFSKHVTRHSRHAAHHRWFPRLLNVLSLTVWIQIVLEAIRIAKFSCQWEAKVNIGLLKLLTSLYRHYWQSSKFQSFCCSWFCRACCRLSRLFSNLRSGAEREEETIWNDKPSCLYNDIA